MQSIDRESDREIRTIWTGFYSEFPARQIMEQTNLFCDIANCSQPASFFGFFGTVKVKTCSAHLPILAEKKALMIDITGYHLVLSVEDIPLFVARKATIERGLGAISAMESKCVQEWADFQVSLDGEKQRVVQVVARCFEEIRLRVGRKYDECRWRMQALRSELDAFLNSKDTQLSELTERICRNEEFQPSFIRVAFADVSIQVSKLVLKSWKETTGETYFECFSNTGRDETVATLIGEEAALLKSCSVEFAVGVLKYAKSLGYQPDDESTEQAADRKRDESAVQFESLFSLSVDEASLKRAAVSALNLAHSEQSASRYKEAGAWLKLAWDLLQRHNLASNETVAIGTELGQVLFLQLGDSQLADTVMRRSFDVELTLNGLMSDRVMQLANGISAMYHHSGRHFEAVGMCNWTLTVFAKHPYPDKNYWTAVFYLSFSYRALSDHQKANETVEEWKDRLPTETDTATMIRAIVLARYYSRQGNATEAERVHRQAQAIAERQSPKSLFAAVNWKLWADLIDDPERTAEKEQMYVRAKAVYEAVAPFSVSTAKTLFNLAMLYEESGKVRQATPLFDSARNIFAHNHSAADESDATQSLRRLSQSS